MKTKKMIINKKGSIKQEYFAIGLLILAAYIGDVLLSRYGENWGYAGIVIGPVLLFVVVQGIAWLERQYIIGQEPLPKCRCGAKNINELKDASEKEPYVAGKGRKICNCGEYIIGRGVIQFKPKKGKAVDYAKWKHGKWEIEL